MAEAAAASWTVWGHSAPGSARTCIVAAPDAHAAASLVGDVPASLWVVEAPGDVAVARAEPGRLLVWVPEEQGYRPADDVLGLRLTTAGWDAFAAARRTVEAVYGAHYWRMLELLARCPAQMLEQAIPLLEVEVVMLRDEEGREGEIREIESLMVAARAGVETAHPHRIQADEGGVCRA